MIVLLCRACSSAATCGGHCDVSRASGVRLRVALAAGLNEAQVAHVAALLAGRPPAEVRLLVRLAHLLLADAAGGSAPAWPGLPAMPQTPVAPEMAGWPSAILWILAILAVYVGIGLGAATRTRNPSHTRLELE